MPSLIRLRVDALLLLVAIAWGSTYLVAKELVAASSVVDVLAARMLLAAGILAAVVAARRTRPTTAEWRVGFVLGLLLSAIFALETYGIAHTSATNAGLLISLAIVFTPLLDAAVSRVRLPGRLLAAAGVSVLGVALLAGDGTLRPPSLGDLLVLGAAVVRAVHVTSMHRLTAARPADSLHLTAIQLGTCAVVFCAMAPFTGAGIDVLLTGFDVGHGILFLYLVLVCTVFAFLVQTWAVRRTSPSRVSLLLGTEPVWAAVIGVGIAHDSFTLPGYAGIALILAGTAWGRSIEQSTRLPPPARGHRMSFALASRGEGRTRTQGFVMTIGTPSDRPGDVAVAPTLREGRADEFSSLVRVWRSAVDATHHFLSDADRDSIEGRLASDYLPNVCLTVAEIGDEPIAFAGTSDGRLEMLFVHDAHRGRGIGSTLIEHVIREQGVREVDVNEQNPAAFSFYTAKGFTVVGRSAVDDAGRPYPLLHMATSPSASTSSRA